MIDWFRCKRKSIQCLYLVVRASIAEYCLLLNLKRLVCFFFVLFFLSVKVVSSVQAWKKKKGKNCSQVDTDRFIIIRMNLLNIRKETCQCSLQVPCGIMRRDKYFIWRVMETVRWDPVSQWISACGSRLSVLSIPPIGCSRMLRVPPVFSPQTPLSCRSFAMDRERDSSPVDTSH